MPIVYFFGKHRNNLVENKTKSALSLDHCMGTGGGDQIYGKESQYYCENYNSHRKLRVKANVHVGIETKRSREPQITKMKPFSITK